MRKLLVSSFVSLDGVVEFQLAPITPVPMIAMRRMGVGSVWIIANLNTNMMPMPAQ